MSTDGFACPTCGGARVADASIHALRCTSCGHTETIAAAAAVERRLTPRVARLERVDTVVCGSCGASLAFAQAGACPFCDRPFVAIQEGCVEAPTAVAPFAVGPDTACDALREAVGRDPRLKPEALHAVFVPVWTFWFGSLATYDGLRGEREERNGKQVMRWTRTSSALRRDFVNAWVSGGSDPRLRALEWDFTKLVPYRAELVAGHAALRPALDLDQAWAVVRKRATLDLRSDARYQIGGDEARISRLDACFSDPVFGHALFPVWAYRAAGGRTVLVNGQSGEVVTPAARRADSRRLVALAGVLIALLIVAGGLLLAVG